MLQKTDIKNIYIRGKSYVFRMKHNGREYFKTLGSVKEINSRKNLRKLAEELRIKVLSGEWDREKELQQKKKKDITVQQLINKFLEWYKTHRRRSSYERYERIAKIVLKHIKGSLKISQLTMHHIERYKLIRKQEGIKDDTLNKELRFISTMINRAVEFEWIENHPLYRKTIIIRGVDNSRIRFLSEDEEKRLVDALKINPLVHDIVLTALYSGLRKNEILGLRWKNIDFENNLIILFPEQTKNKRYHSIPMHPVLKEMLLKRKESSADTDLVFHRNGKPVGSIRTAFENALKRAGIVNFRFHDLRHTFATKLIRKGVDLYVVKELLNHTDVKITQRYAHLTLSEKITAVAKL
ncbi:tyrosine-type recombinase/integrase [Persephonella sp.]